MVAVDPPASAFMLERRLEAWRAGDAHFHLHYRWRPLDQIARSLPMSVIASEDQKFFRHHGFDFDAIDKALDEMKASGELDKMKAKWFK